MNYCRANDAVVHPMTKALIKYLFLFFALLVTGLSMIYAHSRDTRQVNDLPNLHQMQKLVCLRPTCDTPSWTLGKKKPARKYKKRAKMISEENNRDLCKLPQQKKLMVVSGYSTSFYIRAGYLLPIGYSGAAQGRIWSIFSSFPRYLILQMLRI
jgi:hypothetical protein